MKNILIKTIIIVILLVFPLESLAQVYLLKDLTSNITVTASLSDADGDKYGNQIIVQYKENSERIKVLSSSFSDKINGVQEINSNIEVIDVKTGENIDYIINELKKNTSVLYIERNKMIRTEGAPNDPEYAKQWGLRSIMAEEGWNKISTTNKSIVVAVIDSGIDETHPELKNRIAAGGYNFAANTSNIFDDVGHGTMVSGVISAETNNNVGIAGVSGTLDIKVLPLKAIVPDGHGSGVGSLANIVNAIDYAVSKQVDVINLSLGSDQYSNIENDAIQRAINAGITVVASAGNEASNMYSYPASYDKVISVGAIRINNTLASFSNYNDRISVVAPGEDIYTTLPFNSYDYVDGTSFSGPMVAGIAAVLKTLEPSLTPVQIKSLIETSAVDLGNVGKDIYYGYGEANLPNAISKLRENYTISAPRANPGPGLVALKTTIMLKSLVDGASIYYTTDNSTPDISSSKFSLPITINTDTTIKAISVKDGVTSPVATFQYKTADNSKIISIEAKDDSNGMIYEYNYFELRNDFINYQNNKPSPLFSSYLSKTVVALNESEHGYVDYIPIRTAYTNAQQRGEQFDLKQFLQNSGILTYQMPNSVRRVSLYNDTLVEDDTSITN